jgi:hypothetical protein
VERQGQAMKGHSIDLYLFLLSLKGIKRLFVYTACVGYQRWGNEEWATLG